MAPDGVAQPAVVQTSILLWHHLACPNFLSPYCLINTRVVQHTQVISTPYYIYATHKHFPQIFQIPND